MNEHAMPTDPHSLSDGSGHHGSNTDGHFADTEPAKEAHSGMMSASGSADDINVGVIDRLQFSRDCLIRAFDAVHPDLCMVPFASIGDCVRAAPANLDLILYYSHDDGPFELLAVQQIKTLRQAFDDVPIIVLSDAKSAVLPRNIRNALNCGASCKNAIENFVSGAITADGKKAPVTLIVSLSRKLHPVALRSRSNDVDPQPFLA